MSTITLTNGSKQNETKIEKDQFLIIEKIPVCHGVPSVYSTIDGQTYIKTGKFTHKEAIYDSETDTWSSEGKNLELDPKLLVKIVQVGESLNLHTRNGLSFGLVLLGVLTLMSLVFSVIYFYVTK